MATLVKENGDKVEISPANGNMFELEEVQKLVGGYIEIIHLGKGDVMIIDEEGKLKDKQINSVATIVAHMCQAIYQCDCIVGDVVICKNCEI